MIGSNFDYYKKQVTQRSHNNSCDYKSTRLSKRPGTATSRKSQRIERNELCNMKNRTYRSDGPRNSSKPLSTSTVTKSFHNDMTDKEKVFVDILKGLKTMNEKELLGVLNYINSVKDKQSDSVSEHTSIKVEKLDKYVKCNYRSAYISKLETKLKTQEKSKNALKKQVDHLYNIIKSLRIVNTKY